MNESKILFSQIYRLVKEEQNNEAASVLITKFGNAICSFLQHKLGWNEEEATEIFHDSVIAIFYKIKNDEIEFLSLKWIKEYCRNVGSNRFRKTIREKQKFDFYVNEMKNELRNEMQEYLGFDINDLAERDDNKNHKNAIRAFSLLGGKCQEHIKMKFVENMSHAEIVKNNRRLNSERSSITILNRCLKRWKEYISNLNS